MKELAAQQDDQVRSLGPSQEETTGPPGWPLSS